MFRLGYRYCDENGGGGTGDIKFSTTLADDFKDDAMFADFKDVNGLAKAFKDTKTAFSKSLRPPGEDASDEDRSTFVKNVMEMTNGKLMKVPDMEDADAFGSIYNSLGRPEEASGYEIKIPEGIELTDDRQVFLKGLAHKYGMSKTNFGSMMDELLGADAMQVEAMNSTKLSDTNALKGEWGGTYETRVAQAKAIAAKTGAPAELLAALDGDNVQPSTVKWLHSVAVALGGEGSQLPIQGDGSDVVDTGEASLRANEIRAKLVKMSPLDPGYQSLMTKMANYEKQAMKK